MARKYTAILVGFAAALAVAALASACVPQSTAQQTMAPTFDAGGLNAQMTLTANAAARDSLNVDATRAAITLTVQMQQTLAVQMATVQAVTQAAIQAQIDATNAAATPTVAAMWTQQAIEVQEALAAQTSTAETRSLTLTAQAAAVNATGTAMAAEALSTQTAATQTAYAPTETALLRATETAERHAEAERTRLRDDIVAWGFTLFVVALGVLTLVFAAFGIRRFVRRPQVIRRQPNEPAPLILPDQSYPVSVHDPARQFAATVATDAPVDVPAVLQAEVTRLAQQGDVARAFAMLVNQMGQAGVRPAGLSQEMMDQWLGLAAQPAMPRVIILETFDRERLIGAGMHPRQVEVVEGEWCDAAD